MIILTPFASPYKWIMTTRWSKLLEVLGFLERRETPDSQIFLEPILTNGILSHYKSSRVDKALGSATFTMIML